MSHFYPSIHSNVDRKFPRLHRFLAYPKTAEWIQNLLLWAWFYQKVRAGLATLFKYFTNPPWRDSLLTFTLKRGRWVWVSVTRHRGGVGKSWTMRDPKKWKKIARHLWTLHFNIAFIWANNRFAINTEECRICCNNSIALSVFDTPLTHNSLESIFFSQPFQPRFPKELYTPKTWEPWQRYHSCSI